MNSRLVIGPAARCRVASLSYRYAIGVSFVFILRFVVQSVSIGALLVPYIYILLILESKICFEVDGMAKGRSLSVIASLRCAECPLEESYNADNTYL